MTVLSEVGRLESTLRESRDAGRKLLVPYVTGGLPGWERTVEAYAAAGADAIEVGIPFSDPVMDGPTVQAASRLPSTALTLQRLDPRRQLLELGVDARPGDALAGRAHRQP